MTEAAGFSPEADVQKLREAMKGAGECRHISTGKENIIGPESFCHFFPLSESLKVNAVARVAMAADLGSVLCYKISSTFTLRFFFVPRCWSNRN